MANDKDNQGPFDRILQSEPRKKRDPAATVIVALGIGLGLILLVLVLPPIAIFDDGGGSAISGPVITTIREDLPTPPEGFEAVSLLFDVSAEEPVRLPVRLTVNLTGPVSAEADLFFYTYQDGSWRRLGEAAVVGGGTSAQGEIPLLPSNVAVLRPAAQTRLAVGTLRAGSELDQQALSVLTELRLAGFAPVEDGRISGGPLEPPDGVTVPVTAAISALEPSESQAINTILASAELRNTHVEAITDLVTDGGFAGAHLDYSTIDRSLGEEFVELVEALSSGLRAEDRTLSLTLPLPLPEGEEWDTLGFDWWTLAPLVDSITTATDVDPDQYYARVEPAITYLVPRVGRSKLLLAIGPLSRERAVDGFASMTLTEALALAGTPALERSGPIAPDTIVQAFGQNIAPSSGASGLHWDDVSRAVTFAYTGPGGERKVWLANRFSEAFKLDLASRLGLGGVAVQEVSAEAQAANIWPAVTQYVQTGSVLLVEPNGELLEPTWMVSGGTLEASAGAQVAWRTPAEAGTYVLTLVVSDGVVRVGQELQVSVEPPQGVVVP